jgi:hypothetical protein
MPAAGGHFGLDRNPPVQSLLRAPFIHPVDWMFVLRSVICRSSRAVVAGAKVDPPQRGVLASGRSHSQAQTIREIARMLIERRVAVPAISTGCGQQRASISMGGGCACQKLVRHRQALTPVPLIQALPPYPPLGMWKVQSLS